MTIQHQYGANLDAIRLGTNLEPLKIITTSTFNTAVGTAYDARPVRVGPPDGDLPTELEPSGGSSGAEYGDAVGLLWMEGFSGVKLLGGGVGTEDDVGRVHCYAWTPLGVSTDIGKVKTRAEVVALYADVLWVRHLLLDFTLTLGGVTGIANTDLGATFLFAKEFTGVLDMSFGESFEPLGDADIGYARFDASAAFLLEFIATRDDSASGTAAADSITLLAQRY